MNNQDYERLAQYLQFGPDDDKPAQVAEHQRVLELERALTAAQQRIEALESALRWYGDKSHYRLISNELTQEAYVEVNEDCGEVARKALGDE